jgi:hypothetical protein
MKYLLLSLVISIALCIRGYIKAENGPTDDFGAGMLFYLLLLVSVLLALAYVATAIWTHSVW